MIKNFNFNNFKDNLIYFTRALQIEKNIKTSNWWTSIVFLTRLSKLFGSDSVSEKHQSQFLNAFDVKAQLHVSEQSLDCSHFFLT